MNAPFPLPRGLSLRDPFLAFVQDEETAELVRPIAIEHGWSPEKVAEGGLKSAVHALSVAASPSILFVDLSGSGDPLGDINTLAEVCEPGTVVIAAGGVNDVRLYRDLLASGIQDYLLKPFSADHLRDAFANAQASVSGPRGADTSTERSHLLAAVIGARGGVGTSTIASSIAWLMGERAHRSCALLDLDVYFGTGALALDLEPGRGLTDAIENPGRIDGLFIERAMVRANDKLAVLSAEAPINQPLITDGSAYFQLQEEMRSAFETTVVDFPRPMLVQYPQLVHDAQVCVVVAELTLASTRDTIRILSWLKSNAPQAKVIVAANRVGPVPMQEVSRKDFENSIERKVDVMIPFDQKAASHVAKLGQPLAKAPNPKVTQPLVELAALTLAAVEDGAESKVSAKPKSGASLVDRLGGLKGLLPKRAAAPKVDA